MNVEAKKTWIEALRSGDYKQGRSRLCRTMGEVDEFCCLGVLYDVAADGDWNPREGTDGSIVWYTHSDGSDEGDVWYAYLPPSFRALVGLSETEERRLSDMNDSKKMSFPEIANYIEKFF